MTFSSCAERERGYVIFKCSEIGFVLQRETHFHKFRGFNSVLHFISSRFPPFASVCTTVLGMTDLKFLMSWLQGVDFHGIFCWLDAGSLLDLAYGIFCKIYTYDLSCSPPSPPCEMCWGRASPPLLKPFLLFCVALLPTDVLKCHTKPFFPVHFPSKHNPDHSSANTSGTSFPDLILLIALEAHNNV